MGYQRSLPPWWVARHAAAPPRAIADATTDTDTDRHHGLERRGRGVRHIDRDCWEEWNHGFQPIYTDFFWDGDFDGEALGKTSGGNGWATADTLILDVDWARRQRRCAGVFDRIYGIHRMGFLKDQSR